MNTVKTRQTEKTQSRLLSIVKVGGAVLEDPFSLDVFLDQFVALPGLKILVHGGGRAASKLSERLNIENKIVEGRRITDADTLDVVTMVYGGLVNRKTVAALQSKGCNAGGFTGADLNLIKASRRQVKNIDYGFVGDITEVNSIAFTALLQGGITPVIAPITHDGKGQLLNTNADTVASAIAVGLSKSFTVSLIYCFEKPGVLTDTENLNSVIQQLSPATYEILKKRGTIHSGMIPKIDNSFDALLNGVSSIRITCALALILNTGTRLSL